MSQPNLSALSALSASCSLTVLERGWLSANNTLLSDGNTAILFDSGHLRHAAQTEALVRAALGGARLTHLINTHLHSDHCGGNARLQAATDLQGPDGLHCAIPPGLAEAARAWDRVALSYQPTGQVCERYRVDGVVLPGEVVALGPWRFEAMAAPGHDPHALLFFDAGSGTLIAGDALWRDGFGVVFPELDGVDAFHEVEATLDLIAGLPVREVIPGHGARFTEVGDALARARSRLAQHVRNPAAHARHGAKVLIKYHLMELGEQAIAELTIWLAETPLLAACQARAGDAGSPLDFGLRLLDELCNRGALRRDGAMVFDV